MSPATDVKYAELWNPRQPGKIFCSLSFSKSSFLRRTKGITTTALFVNRRKAQGRESYRRKKKGGKNERESGG
jgi:hypothetical protein